MRSQLLQTATSGLLSVEAVWCADPSLPLALSYLKKPASPSVWLYAPGQLSPSMSSRLMLNAYDLQIGWWPVQSQAYTQDKMNAHMLLWLTVHAITQKDSGQIEFSLTFKVKTGGFMCACVPSVSQTHRHRDGVCTHRLQPGFT